MSDFAKQHLRAFNHALDSNREQEPGDFRRLLTVLTDEGTDEQRAGFLSLLRGKETVAQVTEAALFLREHPRMVRVTAPEGAVDIVGTGGDGQSTFNISTAAAFVVAGAGVPVAKHGNRAVSSKSGASDVLAALGVKLDVPVATTERAIREAGVGFLWAPNHHPAMKEWAKARSSLGFRTIFNLLGPLCNPAFVKRQVIGVYAKEWVRPVAEVMQRLGSEHVWVVHGSDGLDELTTTGTSFVAELKGGSIREFEVTPEAVGLERAPAGALSGGDPTANATLLRRMFRGDSDPKSARLRDIVCLNAAVAICVSGNSIGNDLTNALDEARYSISSGAALTALEKLIAITNG